MHTYCLYHVRVVFVSSLFLAIAGDVAGLAALAPQTDLDNADSFIGVRCSADGVPTYRVGDVEFVRAVAGAFRQAMQVESVEKLATYRKCLSRQSNEFSLTERYFPFSLLRFGRVQNGAALAFSDTERRARAVVIWVVSGSITVKGDAVAAHEVALVDLGSVADIQAGETEGVFVIIASNTPPSVLKALRRQPAARRMLASFATLRESFARKVGDPPATYRKRGYQELLKRPAKK